MYRTGVGRVKDEITATGLSGPRIISRNPRMLQVSPLLFAIKPPHSGRVFILKMTFAVIRTSLIGKALFSQEINALSFTSPGAVEKT
jgi:hypothetical protein